MKNKKLYLSNRDYKISGVCGGIAEYLEIDSSLIRVGFIIFASMVGTGIFAYILMSLVIPREY